MATVNFTIPSSVTSIAHNTPFSLGVTCPNGNPIKISSSTAAITCVNVPPTGSLKVTAYFCDSAGSNAVEISETSVSTGTIALLGGNGVCMNVNVNPGALKGKALYMKFVVGTGTTTNFTGSFSGKGGVITYTVAYTAVVAGDYITATDRSQTGTTTTQYAVISDSHFSAGTAAEASTFNKQVLGIT